MLSRLWVVGRSFLTLLKRIVDEDNLLNVTESAEIQAGDFEICATEVDETTFVYFAPPTGPLAKLQVYRLKFSDIVWKNNKSS
jgi:site-specific DNA-adenine methylase